MFTEHGWSSITISQCAQDATTCMPHKDHA
jgi:hypothetical protein